MSKKDKTGLDAFGDVPPPWMTRPFLDEFIRHYSTNYDVKKSLVAAGKKYNVSVYLLDEYAIYKVQNDPYVCKQLKKRARVVKEHNFNYTKERAEVELVRRTYEFDPLDIFELVDREVNKFDKNGDLIESTTIKQMELKDPQFWPDVAKKMIKAIKNTPNGVQVILKDDTPYLKMLGEAYGLFDKEGDDEDDHGEPVTFKISVADGRVGVDHLAR